ncbi:hypothetical protein V5799_008898 [Amblyomma americanum]|uniref:Cytohesin Ubiquitin Protein Inducing domain-containing protein n=1 Tax=Amblyomma americanum TaxID=6943 RepID=A0AAQ4FDG2_AMBAM
MLAALKARKEALEEALRKKVEELKSVCLKEGEVTGELPPEMPLAPGEPPPQVRRRVGTAFILDDQLLSNAKSKEETMSSLELEYELQNKITSAALRLANDMSADRSLRRQRKLCYQQAHEKLKQVEQKLGTLKKQKNHGNKPKIMLQSDDVVSGNHYHPSKSHSYHENMVRHIDECGVPVFVPVDSDGSLRYQDAVHRPVEPIAVYHKPPMPPALIQHHLAHRKKLQEVCGDSFPGRPLSSMSAANYAAFQRVHPDPYLSQPTSPTGYSAAHNAKLETLQEGHSGSYGNQCLSVTVSSSRAFSSVTQSYSTESLKHRAKDWVETSLDSPLPARKPSKQQEPPPSSPSQVSMLSSGSESLPEAVQGPAATLSRHDNCRDGRAAAAESPHFEREKICSPLPQPLSPKTMPGVELNIVTLGHFQPYWEETKPYEISDFYKYSTKHRKPSGSQDSTKSPSQSGNSSGVVSPVLTSPLAAEGVSRERDEQLAPHSSLAERMKMVERSPPDGMACKSISCPSLDGFFV